MVPLATVIFTGSVGEISWPNLGDSDTVATGFGAALEDELLGEELDDPAEVATPVTSAGLTPAVPVFATPRPEVDPEQAAVVASTPTAIRASATRRAVLER
jgi:hypothetical protein